MNADEPKLDATYSDRAIPPGSAPHWSWLFAPPRARGPLLGVYALLAEWRALMRPGVDLAVTTTKLRWWSEEMRRLADRAPLHPITRFLAAQARAVTLDFAPLGVAVEAAADYASGVPLERADELERFGAELVGTPLLLAARLSDECCDEPALIRCTAALGTAEYLAKALADYRSEALAGRMVFAIDELLSAGIENADLEASEPPPRLKELLQRLRRRAAESYAIALALPARQRAAQRGLLVFAALRLRQLERGAPPLVQRMHFADMLLAWRTARRAARAAL